MISVEEAKQLLRLLRQQGYDERTFSDGNVCSRLFFESGVVHTQETRLPARDIEEWTSKGVLVRAGDELYSSIRIVPFRGSYYIVDSPRVASTGGISNYCSDIEGFYGYIGSDGIMLANHVHDGIRHHRYAKALDLCTGSGIIGLSLSPLFQQVIGTDIEPSAVPWAKLNAEVNAIENYNPVLGDLYEPAADEGPFDVITANPSFALFSQDHVEKFKIREHETAGDFGLELVFRIIDGFDMHLKDGGTGFICTLIPIIHGENYFIEKTRQQYFGGSFAFEVHYTHHCEPEPKQFYESLGISRLLFVLITVRKGKPFSIKQTHSRFYLLTRFPLQRLLPIALRRLIRRRLF